MIHFNPANLPDLFISAIGELEHCLSPNLFPDFMWPDYKTDDWEDQEDQMIGLDYVLEDLSIDGNDLPNMTIQEIIELADTVRSAKLIGRGAVHLPSRSIFYVRHHYQAAEMVRFSGGDTALLESDFLHETSLHSIKLVRGSLLFAVLISAAGGCDSDYNASYSDEHFYVDLQCPASLIEKDRFNLLESFLFEVECCTELVFRPAQFPEVLEEWDEDDEADTERPEIGSRIRLTATGKGLSDLHQMFNSSSGSDDNNLKFLGYVRVLEYVSASIVRKVVHDELRSKLLLPEALNPSVEYVDLMQQTLEQLRNYKNDAEALKLTVETCSDAVVLSRYSPKCVASLTSITVASKPEDRRRALRDLSETISSTRNQLSHAKPNYSPRGSECPANQLDDLTKCTKFAAKEAIRYFSDMPERLRLT